MDKIQQKLSKKGWKGDYDIQTDTYTITNKKGLKISFSRILITGGKCYSEDSDTVFEVSPMPLKEFIKLCEEEFERIGGKKNGQKN